MSDRSLFSAIDRLAGWWMNWRTEQSAKSNPAIGELGLKKVEIDENGNFLGTFVTPAVAIMADEAASMLNAAHAENYVQFDMLPRVDRGIKPIRVTVQWANGRSPAEEVDRLTKWLEGIRDQKIQHPARSAADCALKGFKLTDDCQHP